MAQFPVNSTRLDPYKNFKFRVKWSPQPGAPLQYVAGISKVSGLKRMTEVVKHRDGGDFSSSRKSPGRNEYDPITLERGVTQDVEFEQWANKVWDYNNAQAPADQRTMEVSLADFRKEIIIDVFNEAGQKVLSYQVYRCWVSEYQALPDLDANANAIAIQHIKLENEGWIRDTAVKEQPEPSFTDPPS
jgi:phage tail-like protein